MGLEGKVISIVIVIALIALLVSFSRRASKRSHVKVPPMRKLNVPCDPDLQSKVLDILRRERIEFVPPIEPEPELYSSNPYKWTQMPICFVLVTEKDGDRAEEVLSELQGK